MNSDLQRLNQKYGWLRQERDALRRGAKLAYTDGSQTRMVDYSELTPEARQKRIERLEQQFQDEHSAVIGGALVRLKARYADLATARRLLLADNQYAALTKAAPVLEVSTSIWRNRVKAASSLQDVIYAYQNETKPAMRIAAQAELGQLVQERFRGTEGFSAVGSFLKQLEFDYEVGDHEDEATMAIQEQIVTLKQEASEFYGIAREIAREDGGAAAIFGGGQRSGLTVELERFVYEIDTGEPVIQEERWVIGG